MSVPSIRDQVHPTAQGGAQRPPHNSVQIVESSRLEWAIVLLLFVVTCLYLGFFYNYTTLNPVEGIVLQGAQRILNGQVLYRDFFSFYTPGSYYWTALLFKVFGDSVLAPRAALIVYGGIFSVLTYLLARRVCSLATSLLTAYLLTLVCLPYAFFPMHNWDSTLWTLLGLYFAVRLLERPHWGYAAATGVFASLTCLFEQSKGAGLVLGLAMGFGAIIMIGRNKQGLGLTHAWAFLVGFMLPALMTVSYFAVQHSLPQMLADCLWPLRHSGAVRNPYGFMELSDNLLAGPWIIRLASIALLTPCFIILALPLLAPAVLGFWVLHLRRGKPSTRVGYYILISATQVGLLLATLASRPDFIHVLVQAPMFVLILAWGLESPRFKSKLAQDGQTLLKYYVFLAFTCFGLMLLGGPLHANTPLETSRGALRTAKLDPVLEELRARVRPGETIFVYPFQPLYYFLSSTLNPTRHEFLHLGMHTPEQFAEATSELAADRTPLILVHPSFSDTIALSWPDTPIKVLAEKDPLMEYILANYRACTARTSAQSWQFIFMVRKDLSCTGRL